MQTTSCTNPFQSLRIEEYTDDAPIRDFTTKPITVVRSEVVNVLYGEAAPGKWVAGYNVFWANGRNSVQHPSLSNGYFRSASDAQLFVLGFFSQYAQYFLPESVEAIKMEIKNLSQNSLF